MGNPRLMALAQQTTVDQSGGHLVARCALKAASAGGRSTTGIFVGLSTLDARQLHTISGMIRWRT